MSPRTRMRDAPFVIGEATNVRFYVDSEPVDAVDVVMINFELKKKRERRPSRRSRKKRRK